MKKVKKYFKKIFGMMLVLTYSITGTDYAMAQVVNNRTEPFFVSDNQVNGVNKWYKENNILSVGSNNMASEAAKIADGNVQTYASIPQKGNAIQINFVKSGSSDVEDREFNKITLKEQGNNITRFKLLVGDSRVKPLKIYPIYEGTTIGVEKVIRLEEMNLPEDAHLAEGDKFIKSPILILQVLEFSPEAKITEVTIHQEDELSSVRQVLRNKIDEALSVSNSKRASYQNHTYLTNTMYEAKKVCSQLDATKEALEVQIQELVTAIEIFKQVPEVDATDTKKIGYIHPLRLARVYDEREGWYLEKYKGDLAKDLLAEHDRIIIIGLLDINSNGDFIVKSGPLGKYDNWEHYLNEFDKAIEEIKEANGTAPEKWMSLWPNASMMGVEGSVENYINNVVNLVVERGYEGVDLDWEYPQNAQQWKWYSDLIVKLKEELNKYNKKLSFAVSSYNFGLTDEAAKAVDYYNYMMYDMFDSERHHASMELVAQALDTLDRFKIPRYKINVGLAFYGRELERDYGNQWLDYDEAYRQLGENLCIEDNWVQADTLNGQTGTTRPGTTINFGINGVDMNRRKMELTLDQNYGGVMSWHFPADIELDNPLSLMRGLNDQIASHDQRRGSANLALNRNYSANSAQDTVSRLFDEVDFRSGRTWNMGTQTGEIIIDFEEEVTFNEIIMMERFDRVNKFKVEALISGEWQTIWDGKKIGAYKVCQFNPVTATQVKITIEDAKNNVGFYEIEIFMNDKMKNGELDKQAIDLKEVDKEKSLKIYQNGPKFIDITNEGVALVPETDYSISPNGVKVTFTENYLESLPVGKRELSFNFTAGAPQILTIYNGETISPIIKMEVKKEVQSGEKFTVTLWAENLVDQVYAQDLTLQYDNDLFELLTIEEEGTTIKFEEFVEVGKVRLLLAMTSGITKKKSALNLEFSTRDVETTTSGAIKIDQAKLGVINQGNAQAIEAIGECKMVTVKPSVDKPSVDKPDNDDDVTGDGEVNIADLALAAYYYQVKLDDDNWEVAKKADVNQDNIVDIKDLTHIAQKILEVH